MKITKAELKQIIVEEYVEVLLEDLEEKDKNKMLDAAKEGAGALKDTFRELAKKLHPDRGGSKEDMSSLNKLNDQLKGSKESTALVPSKPDGSNAIVPFKPQDVVGQVAQGLGGAAVVGVAAVVDAAKKVAQSRKEKAEERHEEERRERKQRESERVTLEKIKRAAQQDKLAAEEAIKRLDVESEKELKGMDIDAEREKRRDEIAAEREKREFEAKEAQKKLDRIDAKERELREEERRKEKEQKEEERQRINKIESEFLNIAKRRKPEPGDEISKLYKNMITSEVGLPDIVFGPGLSEEPQAEPEPEDSKSDSGSVLDRIRRIPRGDEPEPETEPEPEETSDFPDTDVVTGEVYDTERDFKKAVARKKKEIDKLVDKFEFERREKYEEWKASQEDEIGIAADGEPRPSGVSDRPSEKALKQLADMFPRSMVYKQAVRQLRASGDIPPGVDPEDFLEEWKSINETFKRWGELIK